MKKILTIIILTFSFQVLMAQRAPLYQIERNLVALEIFTGTWCVYCPGAALGADDLINEGQPVAVIEHHSGDAYQNEYSLARKNFYGISSYPYAFFDGIVELSSGSVDQSLYPQYLPLVQDRMEILSPFALDFAFTNSGDHQFNITADISKVADYGEDVVLHIFVTESHIDEDWQILSELNFVNRLMYPDANGTALDFSNSNDLVIEHTLSLDPEWNVEFSEFVIFIQDMQSKEILNTAKAPVLQTSHDHDAAITHIYHPDSMLCSSLIQPEISIKNFGNNSLQTLDISYQVNNDITYEYHWEGELDYLESEIVVLPEIPSILENGSHQFHVSISNPNGEEDGNEDNNEKNIEMEYLQTGTTVYMEALLSEHAEYLSWELIDPQGSVIAQEEYNASNSSHFIEKTFDLETKGCHQLKWYNSDGEGFSENGWCRLYSNGNEVYYFDAFENEYDVFWEYYGEDFLMYPTNPMAIRIENQIDFEWTAVSKANLLGYHIYQWPDLSNPINSAIIEEESYSYNSADNSDMIFFITAQYEEGESIKSEAVSVTSAVGIATPSSLEFEMYPNPVINVLNIDLSSQAISLKWTIFTMTGSIMASQTQNNQSKIQIPTTELKGGVYFIELIVDGQRMLKKFIIAK